jgi:hypothetical protein
VTATSRAGLGAQRPARRQIFPSVLVYALFAIVTAILLLVRAAPSRRSAPAPEP